MPVLDELPSYIDDKFLVRFTTTRQSFVLKMLHTWGVPFWRGRQWPTPAV